MPELSTVRQMVEDSQAKALLAGAKRPGTYIRDSRPMRPLEGALADIKEGLRLRHVWMTLASEDIGDQHKRTTLGPLWLLVNYFLLMAIFVFLFHPTSAAHFASYAASGLLVWSFLSEVLHNSSTLFNREEGMIKGTTLPLSVYVLRLVMQSTIRSGYAAVGCLVILMLDGTYPSFSWIWLLIGAAIIILTAPALALVLAFVGAFFPDSKYITSNLIRLGMFITPVFWFPDQAHGFRAALYSVNPFSYFLELFRYPIMDHTIPVQAYGFCALFGVVTWLIALPVLGRYRKEVVFVL